MESLRKIAQVASSGDGSREQAAQLVVDCNPEEVERTTLTDDDTTCLHTILSKCKDENVLSIAIQTVAEFAKKDENREKLVKAKIIPLLLKALDSEDQSVILQCFRAIGNICMENDEGQNEVLKSGEVRKILEKLKVIAEIPDGESHSQKLPAAAYGCVTNLTCDNLSLQEEMVERGAVQVLLSCIKKFAEHDSKLTSFIVTALVTLAECDSGKEQFKELKVIESLLSYLNPNDDVICEAILESLNILSEIGCFKGTLCSVESLSILIDVIGKRPEYTQNETEEGIMRQALDLFVVLSSEDESLEAVQKDGQLIDKLLPWFKSPNKHVQVSVSLAIGNFARSDENCIGLVKRSVHEPLLELLRRFLDDENCFEQLQASCSALKNLIIPAANKPILASTLLPDYTAQLVKKSNNAVQFKAIGILRLLIQGQDAVAVKLCEDSVFLDAVEEVAGMQSLVGLSAEAIRLTAALIKNCKSSAAMESVIKHKGIASLMRLLAYDHVVMQNEGLVAVAILVTSAEGATDKFVQEGGLDRLTKLLTQSTKIEVVFNVLSILVAMCQKDGTKNVILEHNVMNALKNLESHPEEMVRNRTSELLGILNG